MLISIVGSSIELWDSQLICSQYYSLFPELLDGLLIGFSSWVTDKTIFTGQDRITQDMQRDNLWILTKEANISITLTQYLQKRTKEDKLLKFSNKQENDFEIKKREYLIKNLIFNSKSNL